MQKKNHSPLLLLLLLLFLLLLNVCLMDTRHTPQATSNGTSLCLPRNFACAAYSKAGLDLQFAKGGTVERLQPRRWALLATCAIYHNGATSRSLVPAPPPPQRRKNVSHRLELSWPCPSPPCWLVPTSLLD